MAKPQVTLTFAGDSEQLEKTFANVGGAAKDMESDVGKSSRDIGASIGEGFDTADTRAMGFRDTLTGVQDTMGGVSQIAKGDLFGGFLTLGAGVGDLASGFANLLVPALSGSVSWLAKTRVGMLAQAAAAKVVGAATKVWTGIQAAFNFVMALNPIVLVIIAIVALVAIIIIAYKKSDTFRKIVQAAFDGIVAAGKFLWEGIKRYLGFLQGLFNRVAGWATGLFDKVRTGFNTLVGFIRGLPGRVRSAASGLFSGIRDAFRNAINWVIDAWNGLSFTLPSITVFGRTVGGATLSTPNLPRLHQGGIVPGVPGSETMAILQAGERVTPANRAAEPVRLEIRSGGTRLDDLLVEILARAIRTRGGNVQTVLGATHG